MGSLWNVCALFNATVVVIFLPIYFIIFMLLLSINNVASIVCSASFVFTFVFWISITGHAKLQNFPLQVDILVEKCRFFICITVMKYVSHLYFLIYFYILICIYWLKREVASFEGLSGKILYLCLR